MEFPRMISQGSASKPLKNRYSRRFVATSHQLVVQWDSEALVFTVLERGVSNCFCFNAPRFWSAKAYICWYQVYKSEKPEPWKIRPHTMLWELPMIFPVLWELPLLFSGFSRVMTHPGDRPRRLPNFVARVGSGRVGSCWVGWGRVGSAGFQISWVGSDHPDPTRCGK